MGWVEKMIQYKEKSAKQGGEERVSVGLFDYPVLMAADILLYQTQLVPVGEDQRQHLELTRDIASRFNDQYCKNKQRKTFVEPQPLIQKSNARVMSLQDGTSKMSKSAENDMSRINLLDPPDVIARKIKRCKTDSVKGLSGRGRRGAARGDNLLGIYEAMTGQTREEVEAEICALEGWGAFKPRLTEATIAHLEPLQQRYKEISTHRDRVPAGQGAARRAGGCRRGRVAHAGERQARDGLHPREQLESAPVAQSPDVSCVREPSDSIALETRPRPARRGTRGRVKLS